MADNSRRAFLRRVVVGAGTLTLYANGGFRYTNALAGPAVYKLRILHTNDHHAHVEPIVETNFTPARNHGGVSRRFTRVKQVRAEQATANAGSDKYDLMVLDAGDYFQGTLYYNQYKGYADLDFYRRMGYNVGTIGNHEFDDGPANLAKFIRGATEGIYAAKGETTPTPPAGTPALGGTNFPIVSANIAVAAGNPLEGLIQPRVKVTLNATGAAVTTGIFGLTTQETPEISSPGAGVTFTDPVVAAQAQVDGLTGEGVKNIIALTHIGYGIDLDLAAKTSGISLIIGGHSHTPLGPQPGAAGPYPTIVTNKAGKPVLVLTDWEWGRWLGDIVVTFDANGEATSVTAAPTELVADSTKPGYIVPDPEFETLIGDANSGYKKQIAELSNTPVGTSTVGLDGATANVRSRETNLGNLLTDAMLAKTKADGDEVTYPKVAITNGGGIRASINAGPITYGNVLGVLPFGNTIARTDLTGVQLRAALESGLSNVGAASGTGRFPQVSGLRFSYVPTAPVGKRLVKVEVKTATGYEPVTDTGMYRVYTNNFMLVGGDGYTVFAEGKNKLDIGFVLADALAEYIATLSANGGSVDNADIQFGRIIYLQYPRLAPIVAVPKPASPTP